MKWRVSTTEAEARPHPAPAADVEIRADGTGAASRRKPCGVWANIFPRQTDVEYGEKHKGRGKAGKLSVVPILWESQAETDVSTPHLRG